MPTNNARKHVIPSGADQSINRATIFEAFGNSIRDVVPVANATERAQVVSALTTKGETPSASKPLVVLRADAPGLHRLEYTLDGTTWLPGSGTLFFATKSVADSFGTANGGLLSVGDECRVGSAKYTWDGTAWLPYDTGWVTIGSLHSGWSAPAGDDPQYRVRDGVLYLRGSLNATPAAGTAVNTQPLPASARPSRNTNKYIVSTGGGGTGAVTVVAANGGIVVFKGSAAIGDHPLSAISAIPLG